MSQGRKLLNALKKINNQTAASSASIVSRNAPPVSSRRNFAENSSVNDFFTPSEASILSVEFLNEINHQPLNGLHSAANFTFPSMVCPQGKEPDHDIHQDSELTPLSNVCPAPLEPLPVQFVEYDAGSTLGTSERHTIQGIWPSQGNEAKTDLQTLVKPVFSPLLNVTSAPLVLPSEVDHKRSPPNTSEKHTTQGTSSSQESKADTELQTVGEPELTPLTSISTAPLDLSFVGKHLQITPHSNNLKDANQGKKVRKVLFQSLSDDFLSEPLPLNDKSSEEDRIDVNVPSNDPPAVEDVVAIPEHDALEVQPVQQEVTQQNKRKRRAEVSEHTPPKKRPVYRENWKSSKAKLAYNSGQAHTTLREERESLFQKYYGLKDKTLQWYMLAKLVVTTNVKQRKVQTDDEPYRKHSYFYYLLDQSGQKVPVCQPMFLNTFDISKSVVQTALTKNSPDKRGKYSKAKKRLAPELIANVKDHIKMFPTKESHYCRAESRRQYLDENLTISKMHRLYLMERGTLPHTASLRQYRDIFNTSFNISFFKPKKDQCSQCVQYERFTPEEKEKHAQQHQEHIANKDAVRKLKKEDKELSKDEEKKLETGNNVRVITFDLQKVLYCPKSDVGEFFYKRKLSTYNFTIFDCTTGKAYCFCWDQTVALRGSDEISSCILSFFEEAVSQGVTEFRIYSDSCSKQNKNKFLYSMYYLATMKFNIKITHRYLEKGHTQMECDSIHALIERKTKNIDIFTPAQWYGNIRSAKVQQPAYVVREVEQKDVFSFKTIANYFQWSKVPISKVCEVKFDCSLPEFISYKLQFEAVSSTCRVIPQKKGRPVNWKTLKLDLAHSAPIPLKPKLVLDLKWFLKKDLIPAASAAFYNKILSYPAAQENNGENDIPEEIAPSVELFEDSDDNDDDLD
ncbi:Anoctamin-5 [Frankliniella fusca]|uniref:Anoctamin-5 n=1 Tax=Frankliniella fusca TaxID=407009 RepID=A0AAE1I3K7_9NEOP|nr:Anoctamin-5 [Frankliniella fusca]